MTKKQIDFPRALKSFVGHLEGTQRSSNTIKNYRLDLASFERFLQETREALPRLESLTLEDVELFHDYLKGLALKTNTRRRKLMTVQRFLRYLHQRGKVPEETIRKLPTPAKVERLPKTLDWEFFLSGIAKLPTDTVQDRRDRLLVRLLAETRCLVSEAVELRWEDVEGAGTVRFNGKNARNVSISPELMEEASVLKSVRADGLEHVFLGYNKFGPLGGRLTPRGAELLVQALGPRMELKHLTPRLIRHSGALQWLREGTPWKETRERLGLRSDSAYRAYSVLLKSKS